MCVSVYTYVHLLFPFVMLERHIFLNSYIPKEHQIYFNEPFVPCFSVASSFCSKYQTFVVFYLEELRFLNNTELTFKQLKMLNLNLKSAEPDGS